jgi:hypothetical protein
MEKLNLKFNASKVDEIEQAKKLPIENCIADTSIGMLCMFIQKGLIDDNGHHGVSKAVAMDVIDKYLEESDKDMLVLDIMEALVNGGFLSRQVDIEKMRQAIKGKMSQVTEIMEEM